jgi:uncharacterized protein (TIGR00251 family)
VLTVWVVAGASRTEIAGVHGDALRVRVAAPPEGGRANRALVRHLAGVAGAPVELVGGTSGRRKRLRFVGLSADRVRRLLLPAN